MVAVLAVVGRLVASRSAFLVTGSLTVRGYYVWVGVAGVLAVWVYVPLATLPASHRMAVTVISSSACLCDSISDPCTVRIPYLAGCQYPANALVLMFSFAFFFKKKVLL